jgi:hypothetical protein
MVRGLLDQGRFVISFSRLELEAAGYLGIDIRETSVGDSIELLRALATEPLPLHIVSVNSVFWAISAGLGIRNLGAHDPRRVDPLVRVFEHLCGLAACVSASPADAPVPGPAGQLPGNREPGGRLPDEL